MDTPHRFQDSRNSGPSSQSRYKPSSARWIVFFGGWPSQIKTLLGCLLCIYPGEHRWRQLVGGWTNLSENYARQTGSWKPQFSGWNYSNKNWNHTTQIQTSSPGLPYWSKKDSKKGPGVPTPPKPEEFPVACNLWYEILCFLRSQVDIKSHLFFSKNTRVWSGHVWVMSEH